MEDIVDTVIDVFLIGIHAPVLITQEKRTDIIIFCSRKLFNCGELFFFIEGVSDFVNKAEMAFQYFRHDLGAARDIINA